MSTSHGNGSSCSAAHVNTGADGCQHSCFLPSRATTRLPLPNDGSQGTGGDDRGRLPQFVPIKASGSVPLTPLPTIPCGVARLLFMAALAQSFSSGAVTLYIYSDLQFQPTEATQYWMYVSMTMWLQPLIGWVSDRFVVFGERRRPLFVVSALCSAFIFFLYAVAVGLTENHSIFVLLSLINQLFVMGVYIPLNGMLVEVGKRERETADQWGARMGAVMSQAMTVRSVGSFAGSFLQTGLLLILSLRSLLGVTSVLHLVMTLAMCCADSRLFTRGEDVAIRPLRNTDTAEADEVEPHRQEERLCHSFMETCKKVRDSFDVRDVRSDGFSFVLVLLFVVFYNAMPDASTVYNAYLFNEFGLPKWFYSMNILIGALGSTIGSYIFSRWMEQRSRQQVAEYLEGANIGFNITVNDSGEVNVQLGEGNNNNNTSNNDMSPNHASDNNSANGSCCVSLLARCLRLSTSVYVVFVVGSLVWALAYHTNLMLCTGFVTDVLHIPAAVFIPIDNFFVSLCVRFAFMPTVIMAAEHAPQHFEATAFEVFSVASMAGGILSSLITSLIGDGMHITRDNYSRLYELVLLSIIFKLVPIPVAYFLPEPRRRTEDRSSTASSVSVLDGEEPQGSEGSASGDGRPEREEEAASDDEEDGVRDVFDLAEYGYCCDEEDDSTACGRFDSNGDSNRLLTREELLSLLATLESNEGRDTRPAATSVTAPQPTQSAAMAKTDRLWRAGPHGPQ